MKILITGGLGFIGSHLSNRLSIEGHKISIIDSSSVDSNIILHKEKFEIINGDIRDAQLIHDLISSSDVVFHLAAVLGVDKILHNVEDAILTNVIGSHNVLKSCNLLGKRVFLASTSEIYGKNPIQPLNEDSDRLIGAPQNIRWNYSDAKALDESLAFSMNYSNNLPVTILRFFNTVGPGQSGKYGMVLPRFIKSAIDNLPLNIFGDGSQTRVFCHVQDVVEGLILLLNNKKSIGQVFNIGGNEEISINSLAHKVIEMCDSKSLIKYVPYQVAYPRGFEDMARRVRDVSKMHAYTGWNSKFGIEKIISDTRDYFLNLK